MWNVKRHDVEVLIELLEGIIETDNDQNKNKNMTTITGIFTEPEGTVIENSTIKVFYKKLREEVLINESKTNSSGRYEMAILMPQLELAPSHKSN